MAVRTSERERERAKCVINNYVIFFIVALRVRARLSLSLTLAHCLRKTTTKTCAEEYEIFLMTNVDVDVAAEATRERRALSSCCCFCCCCWWWPKAALGG